MSIRENTGYYSPCTLIVLPHPPYEESLMLGCYLGLTWAIKKVWKLVTKPAVELDPAGLPKSLNACRWRSVNAHSGVCLKNNKDTI